VRWALGKDIAWGMMLNDQIGDCTIAAAYHAMQLWSSYGRDHVLTESDHWVEQTYRNFTGYDGTEATDQGAMEQDILRQWLNRGVRIQEGTETDPAPNVSRIRFFGEVDPRMAWDVKRTINDCGMAYIGFRVPAWLMEGDIPSVWDRGTNNHIVGGHAIILTGYTASSYDLVSWGRGDLQMTQRFFDTYVDEVYAVAHPWWIDATGHTPLGKSLEELEALMKAQQRQ
jgi:hypothetical protein